MNWVVCTAVDRLPALLEGLLRSMPDPLRVSESREQVAVKRMLALEFGAEQQ